MKKAGRCKYTKSVFGESMGAYKDIGLRLEVFGTRGSNPIFGDVYSKYGGSTSCYLVEANDGTKQEAIILDAGSGISNVKDLADYKQITILLSHPHLDHILGLPVFPYLGDKNRNIRIYLAKKCGLSAKEQIDTVFSQPYWPLKISDYPALVEIMDMPESFDIGGVHVDTMDSNHPGGSTIIRLALGESKLIYATDYEHGEPETERKLIEFSRDANLLLYDAQYMEDEYEKCRGYGHSTPEEGIKIKEKSGAKEIVFIHHSPEHNDLFLYESERRYTERAAHFAREGEVFYL